ncbi:MAG: D-ribose pyranase [Clostridiaceae bacterium]|nr:D-ribose pyranase [Clostridiaceae bacterium]
MKKDRIINSALISEIAYAGHTQYIVIGDAGLPIPNKVKTIDLSLVPGIISFKDALKAIDSELVYEKVILASEIKEQNEEILEEINKIVGDTDKEFVSHDNFKLLTEKANVIVRTGETSPYANIILVCGVNF